MAQEMSVYVVQLSAKILAEISFARLRERDKDLLLAAKIPVIERIFDQTNEVDARKAERELAVMYFEGDEIPQDFMEGLHVVTDLDDVKPGSG